jgi:hypothetical protein
MPTYKKNHEVPRSLIQRWASDRTGDVWVFDIDRERMYRSTASGASPYNFAIVPNRYIVMRGNSRNVDVEL